MRVFPALEEWPEDDIIFVHMYLIYLYPTNVACFVFKRTSLKIELPS